MAIITPLILTPGAGVNPAKVIKPGKRVRNWHRGATTKPLREYLRAIDGADGMFTTIIARWRANKAT